jgi:hypothetical protein
MFLLLQSQYDSGNAEKGAVFYSNNTNGLCCLEYDVKNPEYFSAKPGTPFFQNLTDAIERMAKKHNFRVEDLPQSDIRFAVWHNHSGGSFFSKPDIKTIVDFVRIIFRYQWHCMDSSKFRDESKITRQQWKFFRGLQK